MKRITFALTFLVAFLPFTAAMAMAAEEGQVQSEFMTYWITGWKIINFLILVVFLVKVAKKPLKDFLANRRADISESLNEAEKLKENAETEFSEIRQKIDRIDDQVANITQLIEAQGIAQKERIIKNATTISDRLLKEAQEYSKFELRKAKQRLKEELVDMAIDMAMAKIQEKITPEDQDKLTSDYIKNIAAAA
jgi:F-type H+-transporting ATPase subunit b